MWGMTSTSSEPQPGARPALPFGPILRWRGEKDGTAVIEVTAIGDRPAPLAAEPPARASGGGAFARIGSLAGTAFWSARLEVPAATRGEVHFRLEGVRHIVHLPGMGGALRFAFASCNGAESDAAADAAPGGRGRLWAGLASVHDTDPFHLLVLGGDQIYADALWDLPSMRAWSALPRRSRHAAPFTGAMRSELEAHYLATYRSAFGVPAVADVLARIPSLMIWDDHDIVDGWGSRPAAWQRSPVAQGLFEVARRAFCLVQLGLDPDVHAPPHGAEGTIGCVRLIVPDLRSERTRGRVLGAEGRRRLEGAVPSVSEPHAVVIASVPLVNADLSAAERLVAPLQPMVDLYQDDLRDQWMSFRHRREWAWVMGTLLGLARRGHRVTVLSGEIHFGAHGTARGNGAAITQFIASGIAHPPPPRGLRRIYETFARLTRHRAGLRIRMHPVAPDGRRYVAERNWLEVDARPDGTLEAVLHAEESGALRLETGGQERAGRHRSPRWGRARRCPAEGGTGRS